MARAISSSEKAGLVVGLCQDTAVFWKLASTAGERGLANSTVRAAGTGEALRALHERGAAAAGHDLAAWRRNLVRLEGLDEGSLLEDEDEPLLCACFSCLSKMPGGGAPWQGSWRGNALGEVVKALGEGGIILVIEAHSLEEQRDWARTLLKCGCAFVQTHDGAV